MAWWKRSTPRQADAPGTVDMPLIRLEHITKVFKGDEVDEETRALSDVTVDITRGEYVSVSGPSGCGKSTFLAVLAMLDTPTSGRYFLNGRAVDRLSPAEKARVRNVEIGLIFQSFNLIADMTVYENVEYPLTLGTVTPAERATRVGAALDRVGLTGRARPRPGQH
jgi:putative ABC transport system ATP-binding protein